MNNCNCFANTREECICDRIEGYDVETGIPLVSLNDSEWAYLHPNERKKRMQSVVVKVDK